MSWWLSWSYASFMPGYTIETRSINPRTKAKHLAKMLAETGKRVSFFTVKQVLYQHGLKGCSARKKPLLQNQHKKARLQFVNVHREKDIHFWRPALGLMELTLNCLAIITIVTFGGKRGKLASLRTPSQLWSTGVIASCCGSALLQERLVHFTKKIASWGKKMMKKYWRKISKHQPGSWRLGKNGSSRWTMTLSMPLNQLQSNLRTTKSMFWSGYHKALI